MWLKFNQFCLNDPHRALALLDEVFWNAFLVASSKIYDSAIITLVIVITPVWTMSQRSDFKNCKVQGVPQNETGVSLNWSDPTWRTAYANLTHANEGSRSPCPPIELSWTCGCNVTKKHIPQLLQFKGSENFLFRNRKCWFNRQYWWRSRKQHKLQSN